MRDSGDLLIGSIGTTDYHEIVYELDGETVTTDVSPGALAKMCDIGQAIISGHLKLPIKMTIG